MAKYSVWGFGKSIQVKIAIMPISNQHTCVMFDESIAGLNIKNNGIYIDATLGRGGHTLGILSQLGDLGKVLAFDQDLDAIEYAQANLIDPRLSLIHRAFSDITPILNERGLMGEINGILLDLGVSSPQLDNPQRGFSFNADGLLDMRMNQTRGINAAQWIAHANETEIADVLYQFGEEKKSRQIANAIKKYQQKQPINTTLQLANIVAGVVKTNKHKHPATRTFQAIRIFINQEFEQLSQILEQSLQFLAPEARLCVISFHSIEDRIVKRFMQKYSQPKQLPKGLPIINKNIKKMPLKSLGKQFADPAEVRANKRSRSAILRIAQKTDV